MVFQIFLLIVWHLWLFFILPSKVVTNRYSLQPSCKSEMLGDDNFCSLFRPFTQNAAAQSIFFFKACYFIVSSLQITAGYPTRVLSNILATKYSTLSCRSFTTCVACDSWRAQLCCMRLMEGSAVLHATHGGLSCVACDSWRAQLCCMRLMEVSAVLHAIPSCIASHLLCIIAASLLFCMQF